MKRMELDKTIEERRSIRRFKPDPIEKEKIEAILYAGNKAPSAKNRQHWRFHVYQGKAKEELVQYILDEFDKVINEPYVNKGARYSFKIMEQSPVVVLVYNAEPVDHPARPCIQSVSAAIQNMLLKAYDLELGSLWICDVLYIDKQINKRLKTDHQLLAAVSFGYTDEKPKSRTRKTVEDVTTWYE